jgi:hypothetical protein
MCFALGRLIIKGPPKPPTSPRGSSYSPRPMGYGSTVDSDEITVLPQGRYARNRDSDEIVAVAVMQETRTSVMVLTARERDALK